MDLYNRYGRPKTIYYPRPPLVPGTRQSNWKPTQHLFHWFQSVYTWGTDVLGVILGPMVPNSLERTIRYQNVWQRVETSFNLRQTCWGDPLLLIFEDGPERTWGEVHGKWKWLKLDIRRWYYFTLVLIFSKRPQDTQDHLVTWTPTRTPGDCVCLCIIE